MPVVVLVALLPRKPGLSKEDFHRHWRERHGPLVVDTLGKYLQGYEQYHRLDGGMGSGDEWDGIAIQRYESEEAFTAFLSDPSLSVEEARAKPTVLDQFADEVLGTDRDRDLGTRAMLNRDPPDHTRLRKLVSKAFTPRRIESLRPRVQDLVDESLDRAAEAGQIELMSDYAFALPFAVISEMLGMPPTDGEKLREWSGILVRSLEPIVDPALMLAIRDTGEKMRALITDVIKWKREHLSDDLLSGLIAAEENGDMLSDEELLEQVMLLYIAGHETTVNLIGNGTLALLRNRDQLAKLRADRSLDAGAIEEFLRYDAPVQMSRRITLKEVEVG